MAGRDEAVVPRIDPQCANKFHTCGPKKISCPLGFKPWLPGSRNKHCNRCATALHLAIFRHSKCELSNLIFFLTIPSCMVNYSHLKKFCRISIISWFLLKMYWMYISKRSRTLNFLKNSSLILYLIDELMRNNPIILKVRN